MKLHEDPAAFNKNMSLSEMRVGKVQKLHIVYKMTLTKCIWT